MQTRWQSARARTRRSAANLLDPDVVGSSTMRSAFPFLHLCQSRVPLCHCKTGEHGLSSPTPRCRLVAHQCSSASTASGTIGEHSFYNFQNRTIIGLSSARIRAEHLNCIEARSGSLTISSAKFDRKDLRYSAGSLRGPGMSSRASQADLGAGVGTQSRHVDRPGSVA